MQLTMGEPLDTIGAMDLVLKLIPIVLSVLALTASVLTFRSASRWRARPFLTANITAVANGRAARYQIDSIRDNAISNQHGLLVVGSLQDLEVDEGDSQSDQSLRGYAVQIHNQGSAPAYGVELHIDRPADRSAARLAVGSFVAIGPTTLSAGGDPTEVILCVDRGYSSRFDGAGRWQGQRVVGLGDFDPSGSVPQLGDGVRARLTWREPPNLDIVRSCDVTQTGTGVELRAGT